MWDQSTNGFHTCLFIYLFASQHSSAVPSDIDDEEEEVLWYWK